MLKSLAGFLFRELGMIWRKASQSCTHCKVPVTRLRAEDSKIIGPAIKKLAPMRVRPIKRDITYKMINTVIEVSRGNYRDIAEETVTEPSWSR